MKSIECQEQVKHHTRQKHAFLEAYLRIWTENVGKKSKSKPTLEIYDLYASFGSCRSEESGEEWNGSAIIAAKCLMDYKRPKSLWLNSYSPTKGQTQKQIESLKHHLKDIGFPSRIKLTLTADEINDVIEPATSNLNVKWPSIWILDPYSPSGLPWWVVERIANLKHTWANKNGTIGCRRPELFINLMTFSLSRNSNKTDGSEEELTIAFGMPREEWKPILDDYRNQGLDTQSSIIEIYGSKLEAIYRKKPIAYKIKGTEGNVVYTLFLVTMSDAGYYMMKLKGLPQYQEWRKYEWTPKAEELKAKRSVTRHIEQDGVKQSWLEDFDK